MICNDLYNPFPSNTNIFKNLSFNYPETKLNLVSRKKKEEKKKKK